VLDAIARVLRLNRAERAHLFHLARVELPLPGPDYPRTAPTELAALVAALDPHPAYLIGPRTDVLAWNAASGVIADFGALSLEERNLLRFLLLDRLPEDRGYEDTAHSTLARFRAAHARYIDDPDFAALIAELEERSPDFRAWWPRHDVLADQAGTKSIAHWHVGPLRLHHLQTAPTSHPELRLTIYAPADEQSRTALAGFVAEVGARG
jgi:hypothetical protein